MTGITSRIIHSGRLPLFLKASTTFKRLANFKRFCIDVSFRILSRISRASWSTSSRARSSLIASAPMPAVNWSGYWSTSSRYCSSVRLWRSSSVGHVARIDDAVRLEVEDALELAERHVEQVADPRRQPLEEPDVAHGGGQLDVPHPLAADLALRDLDAALVADDAAVLHALELAAEAFPVGDRTEDLRAEQPVALRLEGPVVDGLRLGHFAVRPRADLLRRRQRDPDGVEVVDRLRLVEQERGFAHRTSGGVRSSRGRERRHDRSAARHRGRGSAAP